MKRDDIERKIAAASKLMVRHVAWSEIACTARDVIKLGTELLVVRGKLTEARAWIEEEDACMCNGYGMGPPPCRRCKVLAAIDAKKEEEVPVCPGCSEANGTEGWAAVRHDPPLCKSSAEQAAIDAREPAVEEVIEIAEDGTVPSLGLPKSTVLADDAPSLPEHPCPTCGATKGALEDIEQRARRGAEHAEQNGDGERTQLTLLSLAGRAHMALASIDAPTSQAVSDTNTEAKS